MTTQWTSNEWRMVIATLGRFKRGEISTRAVAELQRLLGEPGLTYNSLKHRMKDAGLESPSKWAQGGSLDDLDQEPETVRSERVGVIAESVNVVHPSLTNLEARGFDRQVRRDDGVERVAIIPDVHVPEQDPVAWPVALAGIAAFRPDTIVFLGDFCDFNSISSHGKRPDKIEHLKAEVEAANKELDRVQAIGAKRVIFCEGNHCFRAARFIADHAPALYGMFTVPHLLRMEERGWDFIPYRSFAKIGKLHFTHDCGHAGTTSAARSRESFGTNVIVGHSHCATVTYRGDAHGESHVGVSGGWLGNPKSVSYMHKVAVARNWQHAFSVAYIDKERGDAHVNLIPIVNGRCCVEGRLVEA